MQQTDFTPALGRPEFTAAYDLAIRLLTRERRWRSLLLRHVAPQDGETILDVGCGTGTFAIMLKQLAPGATIIGLDPDATVLRIAADKAAKAGVAVEWKQGFAHDAPRIAGQVDKAVSSLVFHQVALEEKRAGVAAMWDTLTLGGAAYIADYALQPGIIDKLLFRATVQFLDGISDTQPNADGVLERIIENINGKPANALEVVPTATGKISLFELRKLYG